MSGPEAKNPPTAGISPPDDVDVDVLFERLRAELRRGTPAGDERGAELFWPVTAERDAGGGLKGLVKRVLRKLMRWYVEPMAADQRVFNDALLKLVDALSERADETAAARAEAERLLRELEERLVRVERRRGPAGAAASPAPTVAAQPRAGSVPDYFAYESRMRGSTESVRERQRVYVDDLRSAAPVLDIGCGRGELLARQSGFAETELRFLNQPAERLTEPDDPVIAANVRRLNELLFAPLDYALVARTPATDA